jgi:hypothetical protein
MSTQIKPIEVFISYAREDESYLWKLHNHLSILKRKGHITTWYDRQIVAGAEWEDALDTHLETASLILLLVSDDFLASDYCYEREMQRALQRRDEGSAHVVPIIVRRCDWKDTPLGRLQALPRDAKPIKTWSDQDEAFVNIVKGIRQLLPEKVETVKSGTQKTTVTEREAMQTVKALFLAANPASTNRLAIDEEMRAIDQKVRAAEYRDVLVFQSNWAVRPDDLLQLLNQHHPQIVHFSGHGSQAGLYLAGNDGQVKLVTARALAALFTTLRNNIRLIFLNACYSREQAQTLVKSIDCVIGMKESIGDDAAIVFASSFYRAIGFGRSIQEAFDQGIVALLLEGIPEEDIPELLVKDGIDPKQVVLVGPNPS